MKHEILLGLTTTPKSDWRGKVEEMKKFGIKRIALFPTFLGSNERKDLYALLETVPGLEIPHIHLRTDMDAQEIDYLAGRYKTEAMNIHPSKDKYPFLYDYSKFARQIYVENTPENLPSREDLEKYEGLCIDFAHWEDGKIRKTPLYRNFSEKADNNPIGCCHVSAIKTQKWNPMNYIRGFDEHYLSDLQEVDYMQKYKRYLPEFISLELENSFEKQLEVKKYLEDTILK